MRDDNTIIGGREYPCNDDGTRDAENSVPEDKWYPWFRHKDGRMSDPPRLFPDSTEEEWKRFQGDPAYDFILGALNGERHGLFAQGSLHLIQGSSGAGKTTFGLSMLKAQFEMRDFLGREGYQKRYLVVWQDRGKHELARQLDNMNMADSPPPYVIPTVDQMNMTPDKALAKIYDAQEGCKPRVLFVEGLDLWVEDAKDMRHVTTVASNVRLLAEEYHISVIATVGMPKMKPKERYTAPRDRAFGSSAWARRADTVVDITVDEETQCRDVQILSRTGPVQRVTLAFENGLLVPREPKIVVREAPELPSLREIMRAKRCGPDKAKEILSRMS